MKRQEANDLRIRQFGSAEEIAFICECADEDCRRSVVLSPGTFIYRREQGELILFPGHEPLADRPMAGEQKEATAPDSSVV
jgi:hypothetical protein